MNRTRLTIAALAVLTAAGITLAHAAGMFSNMPIYGNASYSAGLVTVPAGPTALTGTEVLPMDTGYASGVQPQTMLMPLVGTGAVAAGAWSFETHPTTASSVTISNNIGLLFVTASAAKAGLTVTFPSSPVDGQKFTLATNVALTAIGFSPNTGQSVNNMGLSFILSPTAATTTAGLPSVTWMYRLANTTWYRIV